MTYAQWLHFLAKTFIVCAIVVVAIDFGCEQDVRFAIRLKWSLLWYVARYVAMGCALALAIDVLRR